MYVMVAFFVIRRAVTVCFNLKTETSLRDETGSRKNFLLKILYECNRPSDAM
jgi:hypothetical protein